MTKYKHLTLSDRNDIQLGLERGETFKAIWQSILKDKTTVSKEVKRNRQSESLHAITFLVLYSTKLPLSVTVTLKEDRIVAIRRFYT